MVMLKCDRCGMPIKEPVYPVYKIKFPFSELMMGGIYRPDSSSPEEESYAPIHLCGTCATEFEDYWNERE